MKKLFLTFALIGTIAHGAGTLPISGGKLVTDLNGNGYSFTNALNVTASTGTFTNAVLTPAVNTSAGVGSVDVDNRTLYDAGGPGAPLASVDWGARILKGDVGGTSIDWGAHILKDAASNTILDWGAAGFVTFTGLANPSDPTDAVNLRSLTADNTTYDNTESGLTNATAQAAIDELARGTKAITIIGLGQSNMVGTPADSWGEPYTSDLDYSYIYAAYAAYEGAVKATTGIKGPELSASRWWLTNGYDRVYWGKAALGGTSLAVSWEPNVGSMWPYFEEAVDSVYANQGKRPEAIWWVQGQGDAALSNGWVYADNLTNFIYEAREYIGDHTIPFIIAGCPNQGLVFTAQAACPLDEVYYVRTDDIWNSGDTNLFEGVHYNVDGLILLGERMAAKTKDVLENRTQKRFEVSKYKKVIECNFDNGVVNALGISGYEGTDASAGAAIEWRDDESGAVYNSNETGDYFYFLGANTTFAGDFSIRVKYCSTNDYGTRSAFVSLCGTRSSGAATDGVQLFQSWSSSENLNLVVGASPVNNWGYTCGQNVMKDLVWTFEVATSNHVIYVNGEALTPFTQTTTGTASPNNRLYFHTTGANIPLALFDRVDVWERILSRDEIDTLTNGDRREIWPTP